MMFDFKKEYKEFYLPKNKPEIVQIPKANYIAVRGKGDPNEEEGAYQQAIGVLYAIAYTLKMSHKSDYKIEGFSLIVFFFHHLYCTESDTLFLRSYHFTIHLYYGFKVIQCRFPPTIRHP